MLPSVKKFKGSKNGKMKEIVLKEEFEEKPVPQSILGLKKKRGEQQKYHLKLVAEEKLTSMIWDMVFAKDDMIIITTSDGAYLCDENLENFDKLENIILGGGITLLSDGKIVVLCRFMDAINIFTSDGSFLKAFSAGFSPSCVVATAKDELLVSDIGLREIRLYTTGGKLQHTIKGGLYNFSWPLYMDIFSSQDILVCDCHNQKVIVLNSDGVFQNEFNIKTYGGNQVLRPHGLCINNDDVFIIDQAIDSLEVFLSDGTYLQTLLPSEEGFNLKPKVCRASPDGQFLLIGGMTGYVRLYKIVTGPVLKEELGLTLHVKSEPVYKMPGRPAKVKREQPTVKQETSTKRPKRETDDIIVLD